jgi:hypothetical protein
VAASIRIGCSGWLYRDWRGRFYERNLPANRWLEFYAERFDTVELNASFYRLQSASTYRAWASRLPVAGARDAMRNPVKRSGFARAVRAWHADPPWGAA